jgi:hypothetical protein
VVLLQQEAGVVFDEEVIRFPNTLCHSTNSLHNADSNPY